MSRFKGIWQWGRERKIGRNRRTFHHLEYLEDRTLLAAPMVSTVSPANIGVGVGIAAKVAATFNEGMNRTTINTNTFQLRDSSNNLIPAAITYNAANNTATLDTNAPLAYSATYTATIQGGSTGVKDTSGNAMGTNYTWSFTTGANPNNGPGGPILVVTAAANPFSSYYAEILRSEGLNEFATADISTVTTSTLTGYDVVILAQQTLNPAQVTMFSNWVNSGGDLIAMHPDKQLAGLLGLTDASSTLSDSYLLVNTASGPGFGITNQTIQYHGPADLYTLNGATSLATLYSNATTPTSNPAVTLRNVGTNGGQAAAFTYDLANSVVCTHQGNPAWEGQHRDGQSGPVRSDDQYYGAASFDPQPDYVNLNRDSIPAADEQQRFLANLITQMDLAKKPLPRFWYFPNGAKAMVLESGDDHGNGGTAGQFDTFLSDGTSGGQPIRASSYIYPNTPLTDAEAASYTAQGFEVGVHFTTDCMDYTPVSLDSDFTNQLSQWQANFPSLPTPSSNRTHCIAWSDYSSEPQVELNHRIRLDTNYYYWPGSWIQDRPGLFTGSAMPMRFTAKDGTMIDTYQATTQMTDESGQSYPKNIGALLNAANGPQGYYGVFTDNAHTDTASSTVADNVISVAQLYNNPVVSGRQLLSWLDGRNNSSFGSPTWNATAQTLSFTITTADGANGLQAMVPLLAAGNNKLTGITQNGTTVAYTTQRMKGVDYAFFPANAGSYTAQYAPDTQPPTVVSQSPASNATGVATNAAVTATFSEDMDPATISTTTFTLTGPSGTVPATVTYDTASKTATLTPTSGLAFNTAYTATISGAKDVVSNATAPNPVTWSFTTGSTVASTSIWKSPPSLPDVNPAPDANGVELGFKFRSLVAGTITGIRFFKGDGNTGTHVGHLWSSTGTLLATATFIGETAAGWQQVNFASPVSITAGTTYVASYFAPNGNYAATNSYFSGSGVDSWPLRALRDGEDGPNGLYLYGSDSFPTNSYLGSNYWVDVVFASSGTSTTPAVTATSPTPNATNVATTTAVTATFNEAMNPATISTSTFTLTGPNNTPISGSVTYTDTPSHTATFALPPNSYLANSTTYTATIVGGTGGVKDTSGNAMAANYTWSFTTAAAAGPYSIWSSADVPGTPFVSDRAVEVGVKFTSDVPGTITGIRFYKGVGNTGTHVGHLWTFGGTLLASATFTGETASGWQQVKFTTPVTITAGTVYVASYHSNKGYAEDDNYFTTAHNNVPLHALADATNDPNGVYRYVAGNNGGFPTTGNLKSNYWVDVVFSPSTGTGAAAPAASLLTAGTAAPAVDPVATRGGTGAGAGATAPTNISTAAIIPSAGALTIVSIAPKVGATGVNTTASLAATFSGPISLNTISGSTVMLLDTSGTPVPVAITYSKVTNTVRLTPEAELDPSTTYTFQIKGGATGVTGPAGALAANFSWKFTTVAQPGGGPLPTVTAMWPSNGASGVNARSTKVIITFSDEMDPATINEGTIQLRGKGIGPGGSVPYRVTYGAETHTATIETIGLLPGTPYTVTIKGGAKGVKDQKGNALGADQTTSFTTSPTVTGA
jgi:hypothetical protein